MTQKRKNSSGYELSKNVKKQGGNRPRLAARGRESNACQLKIAILTLSALTLNNPVI